MNNADSGALSAILRNPFPVEKSLTDMAGVIAGLLGTVAAQSEKLAKLENLVETLIEESAEQPRKVPPPSAHSLVLPGISSGDGKALFRCACGWDSGWLAGNDGLNVIDGHIAREMYGYVPDSAEAVAS